jgi:endo-1,4-beta-xylanase
LAAISPTARLRDVFRPLPLHRSKIEVRGSLLVVTAVAVLAGCSSKSAGKPIAPPDAAQDLGPTCGVPTTFAWTSAGPILAPQSDATHDLVSLKDPSVIHYGNLWRVFASTVDRGGNYNMAYLTFPDWDHTANATFYDMNQTPGLSGYHAAPEVFYFAPQNRWYLVYQSGPPTYSTTSNIDDPATWTAPAQFFDAEPDIVTQNKGSGGWLDFWVICDDANCYLFFSDDNGHWYRSQTAVGDFPGKFSTPVIVLEDANKYHLFEASNVYKLTGTGKYLALIEAFDDSGDHRYFRSWTADALDGDWTPLADTYANPFASVANVTFTVQPAWTKDISHGEMIRDGYDQHLSINSCHLQYLYQGVDPTMTNPDGGYNAIPWRLGLLTSTVN